MLTPAQIAAELYPALNARDFAGFIAHYHPTVDYRDPDAAGKTADELRAIVEWQAASCPDYRLTVKRVTSTEKLAIVELDLSGTFQNDMEMPDGTTIKANGRTFDIALVEVFEVDGGRITRHRCYWDNLDVYTQLGILPEPVAA